MALLRWGQEEETDKDLFDSTPVKRVQSVQSSWQPTQGGGATDTGLPTEEDTNYLMSDQKANFDAQVQQRRAEEAEMARRAAAAAEAARVAAETENARRVAAAAEQERSERAQTQLGTKYTQPERKGEGLWGLIKGLGAGIQQGVAAVGDVAVQGGGLLDYAGQRIRGVDADTAARNMTRNTERIRDFLRSGKDITGRNFVGTQDVEEQASRIASGNATLQDYIAVGGKGLQVGLDSTMFLNPARMAISGAGQSTRAAEGIAANLLARGMPPAAVRALTSPALRYAARDATFYGGLQGVATTGQQYGQTGDLEEALKAGATDAVIGGLVQGGLDLGGSALNRGYKALLPVGNKLRRATPRSGEFRIGDEMVDLVDQPRTSAPARQADPLPDPRSSTATPAKAATRDDNISFERRPDQPELGRPSDLIDNAWRDTAPQDAPGTSRLPNEVTPVVETPPRPSEMDAFTPVKQPETPQVEAPAPVADGAVQSPASVVPAADPKTPRIRSEEVRDLQNARAGKTQAEEAAINAEIQRLSPDAPKIKGNLPDDMTGTTPAPKDVDPTAQGRADIADRVMTPNKATNDTKQRLANAVGLEKDAASAVKTILSDGGVTGKQAARIEKLFKEADDLADKHGAIQKNFQKGFKGEGVAGIRKAEADKAGTARQRNAYARDEQILKSRLEAEIRALERSGFKNIGERLQQDFERITGGRSANMLDSAAVVERGITSDIFATGAYALKNPIRFMSGLRGQGNIVGSSVKSSVRGWKDGINADLKTPGGVFKYVTGNTFQTAMAPAQAATDLRGGVVRNSLAEWIYKDRLGKKASMKEARELARGLNHDVEILVNMAKGVENGTVNDITYRRALKNFKKFVSSGSDADYSKYIAAVQRQSRIVDAITNGMESKKLGRSVQTTVNFLLPFMRNASNMTTKTFTRDLNPFARSLVDEIRLDQMGSAEKVWSLLKNKTVDYGVLAALASTLTYSEGDEGPGDKSVPRGVSIHLGGDNYFSVRGTPIELPLVLVNAAKEIARDAASGDTKPAGYYTQMIQGSIPYVDQMEQHSGVVGSIRDVLEGNKEGDGGYAAKSAAVNLAKSLTPLSNNNVSSWVERNQGKSTEARVTYDKDPIQWYINALGSQYSKDFRDSLPVGRDNAGRVRTVDNQGAWMIKTINDENTKKFNDTITDLVDFARKSGIGSGTQEMFNTYDSGKNNHFNSAMSAITFLDAPEVNGKSKPDNATKLEVNDKLYDLNQQLYKGFFGDDASDLLKLDGKELRSDAATPGKNNAGKNSGLPLSVASIRNAIAQTDLPQAEWDKLNEISAAKSRLAEQAKAGTIKWKQYYDALPEYSRQENAILAGSPGNQRLQSLMGELRGTGFFEKGGLGSTRAGQTYLWNSLNALIGSKGKTPMAQWDTGDGKSGWGSGGRRGSGIGASNKPGDRGSQGVKWTPVKARQMAQVQQKKYTPLKVKVSLGNAVKKDRTQNYADRSF